MADDITNNAMINVFESNCLDLDTNARLSHTTHYILCARMVARDRLAKRQQQQAQEHAPPAAQAQPPAQTQPPAQARPEMQPEEERLEEGPPEEQQPVMHQGEQLVMDEAERDFSLTPSTSNIPHSPDDSPSPAASHSRASSPESPPPARAASPARVASVPSTNTKVPSAGTMQLRYSATRVKTLRARLEARRAAKAEDAQGAASQEGQRAAPTEAPRAARSQEPRIPMSDFREAPVIGPRIVVLPIVYGQPSDSHIVLAPRGQPVHRVPTGFTGSASKRQRQLLPQSAECVITHVDDIIDVD